METILVAIVIGAGVGLFLFVFTRLFGLLEREIPAAIAGEASENESLGEVEELSESDIVEPTKSARLTGKTPRGRGIRGAKKRATMRRALATN